MQHPFCKFIGCRFCAAPLTNGLDGAGELLRILVNEASWIARNHFLNSQPHERTVECADYANRFKPKTMMTWIGELTFEGWRTEAPKFAQGAEEGLPECFAVFK